MLFIVAAIFEKFLIIVYYIISSFNIILLKRKVMAAIQIRRGPNVIGFGILQPLADGLQNLIRGFYFIVFYLIVFYLIVFLIECFEFSYNSIYLASLFIFTKKSIYPKDTLVFKFLIILVILLLVFSLKNNVVHCGTAESVNPIGNLQATATQIVLEQMTDLERDDFLRRVGFRPIEGWEAVDYYHHLQNNNSSTFNYQGFYIWVAATAVLFICAMYGDIIRDFVFSLPARAINIAPDIYTGLNALMRNLGREAIFRQEIINFIQNPENAGLVQNALEVYLRARGVQA